jgi:hypothetical protein
LDRNELIRFEGGEAHDGNTCVTQGFACGLNPIIPDLYAACRVDAGNWAFINTAGCALPGAADPPGQAGNPGPYLYIAIYTEACSPFNDSWCVTYEDSCSEAEAAKPARFPYCTSQEQRFGFLEVVDAPTDADAHSPDSGLPERSGAQPGGHERGMIGRYRTADGHLIQSTRTRPEKPRRMGHLAIDNVVTEWTWTTGTCRRRRDRSQRARSPLQRIPGRSSCSIFRIAISLEPPSECIDRENHEDDANLDHRCDRGSADPHGQPVRSPARQAQRTVTLCGVDNATGAG